MSNELQQKYPKFYPSEGGKPHLWIDAIEVECITPHAFYVNPYKYKPRAFEGETEKFTANTYFEIIRHDTLKHFAPLFKPQEGEAFIKDLESAVKAVLDTMPLGIKYLKYHEEKESPFYTFDYEDEQGQCEINIVKTNIAQINFSETESDPLLVFADVSIYVDTLRKLGYYL